MGIVVFVAVIQVDDAITEAMTSKLVGLVVHVDDAHRRAWSLHHQLTRAVTERYVGMALAHPLIEGEMEKDVRQNRAD